MKKLIFIFILISFNVFAIEKDTTFNKEVFMEAQKAGKTVVINSWNKTCITCAEQIKILQEAEKKFNDVLFLSYAQKNKDIAKYLNIDYRSTIVVYKDNKEIARAVGITKKEEIYSLIKKGI